MNFKKSLTALAVAGVIATPMAAQADLYASARIGLISTDTGGVSDLDVNAVASRMGVKSETDLGNGMTGFGKYEFSVNESGAGALGIRHQIVGLKGDFGSVTLGQTYHTFYNHVVGPMDIPWIGSGVSQVAYVGRTGDAITYAGGSGDISFGATAYFVTDANEDAPDGTEFGVSFGVAGMTLGLAMQDSEAQDDAVTGVALHGIDLGGASLGVGFQTQGDDSSFLLNAGIGNANVHFESLDIDGGAAPTTITLTYNVPLGRKTLMYFEYVGTDADTGNSDDDSTTLAAVLKYDIE
jgi:predicted porin